MTKNTEKDITARIIEKTREFGACLAGISDVEALRTSPSHFILGKLDEYRGVSTKNTDKQKPGFTWPEDAKSAIIIAVEHPEEKAELDWWTEGYGGTPGNRILVSINDKLSAWLENEKGIKTKKLPYHIEYGGIFLKDAAVMAGLGCLGKNNMLVTREFGPRVRLRAMFTYKELKSTGPIDFDPCEDCSMPCRATCPQGAFQRKIYSEKEFEIDKLPARTGIYSRHLCNFQMQQDRESCEKMRVEGQNEPGRVVRFCRRCELTCPVGKHTKGMKIDQPGLL